MKREAYSSMKSEIRVFQSVLRNAVQDLEDRSYEATLTGRLCDDVANLGFAQDMVIQDIFSPRVGVVKRRLAARVCESCVMWVGCSQRVRGGQRMDENDPFMVFESDRKPSGHGLNSVVTLVMRQHQNSRKNNAYHPKVRRVSRRA